jgi:hypothetical protein
MSVWKTLLKTAIHAPSPHNVQPWRVRILSDTGEASPVDAPLSADLLIEKRRTLPKEDHTGSFIILTMGLFIEALAILAANRSLELHYELYQAPSQYTPEHIAKAAEELLPFAKLTLHRNLSTDKIEGGRMPADRMQDACAPPTQYDDSLFFTRRTSRISLLPTPLADEAVQALKELATAWGQKYEQVTTPDLIEQILAHNVDALFHDLNAPDYHDEIVEWFRFTDRQSRRERDGLDYRCMNSSHLSFWLAARLPKLMLLPIARPMLKKIYRRQLGIVPTVGMLGGPFWEPASAFETGRFLMHFWLELAKRNLYLHPYGNLVTNKSAAEWCRAATGVANIWLIFKIGFSEVPPKSYRRSVEEVLVD